MLVSVFVVCSRTTATIPSSCFSRTTVVVMLRVPCEKSIELQGHKKQPEKLEQQWAHSAYRKEARRFPEWCTVLPLDSARVQVYPQNLQRFL